MSTPPYMPLYVGDYFRDTHHLSRSEHGAYLLLLMAMWSAGGRLPSTDVRLAQLAHCTPEEWAAMRETILVFFKRRGGHIRHKRMGVELAKYANKIERAKKGGKSSASKKTNENNNPKPVLVDLKFNQPEPKDRKGLIDSPLPIPRDAPILPDEGKSASAPMTVEERRKLAAETLASMGLRRRRA